MRPLKEFLLFAFSLPACFSLFAAVPDQVAIEAEVKKDLPSLAQLYQHLHSHPELSFHEVNTSAKLADEFRKAGFDVATGIGKYGVVAVLRNGAGSTVLVRTDMDALPVKEQTGLSYASAVITKDGQGNEVSVMHACGHDVHMACAVGTARALARLKSQWHGTLVIIGQPAEEKGGGARAMLADGLFQKFPKPNVCLALHDSADLASGMIGYTSGFSSANVNSVDITVYGVGGHGAHPDKTKDPIVLAAQIILALQTIVSREIAPGEPAVVTVGAIHGGTKHNIIPDEVQLQLTVRSYSEEVRKKLLEGIERVAKGQAVAAGLPQDKLPRVTVSDDVTAALYLDPQLADRMVALFKKLFGDANVVPRKPTMGGEDFSEFGRTEDRIPVFMFSLGAVRPESFAECQNSGKVLPSLHSSLWAPNAEPAIRTGVVAMSAAVLELMRQGSLPAQ